MTNTLIMVLLQLFHFQNQQLPHTGIFSVTHDIYLLRASPGFGVMKPCKSSIDSISVVLRKAFWCALGTILWRVHLQKSKGTLTFPFPHLCAAHIMFKSCWVFVCEITLMLHPLIKVNPCLLPLIEKALRS